MKKLNKEVIQTVQRPEISTPFLNDPAKYIPNLNKHLRKYARNDNAQMKPVQAWTAVAALNGNNVAMLGSCNVGKTATAAVIGKERGKLVISVVATRALQLSQCLSFSRLFDKGENVKKFFKKFSQFFL